MSTLQEPIDSGFGQPRPIPYAIDPESAARLWSLSEHLLRLKPQATPVS